jgi:crotonobetainyl-CoA:carnitine CoA-transferase CaiB-like acyl-CoA transferase
MLSPYRVLDLTTDHRQLCGQILGDLGADVLLLEPPGGSAQRRIGPFAGDAAGPGRSLSFWAYNRNKRATELDLDTIAGRSRLRELAAGADVLIEGFAPGHLDRMGLSYRTLSAINPGIIRVSITPFGLEGPRAKWPASDLTVLAASGTLFQTGDDDRPPVAVGVPQAYLHAAGDAAVATLMALAARERDGLGQQVDVSAQASAMMATQFMILSHGWGEAQAMRLGGGVKLGQLPIKLVYPAADGYVSVTFLFGSAIGPFSRRLMEVMHEEGFVDEATRDKDWIGYTGLLLSGKEPISEFVRCMGAIATWTKSHTKAELYRLAMDRRLLIVPVATTEDVVRSAQLAARNYWATVAHPELGRDVVYPGAFAKLSATPITTRRRPPLVNEHAGATFAARPRGGLAVPSPRKRPLEGLKVLDFMWVIAGPAGSRYLADYGATHVRVESSLRVETGRTIQPFKDGVPGPERSGLFANANAGKLGLTLNLGTPEGLGVARKLAAWADVILESYSPKAMKGWGLDYESVRAFNPGVVMLSSCLNGQTGPDAMLAGFGTMGAQLAGFGELAGWPDRPPAGPFGAYTDYVAPRFTVASLLAALDHRRRTGQGQYIDLSQSEASLHFLGPAILDYTVNGRVQSRRGNSSPDYAPHAVFPASGEERWVAIVCETDSQWRALASATGNPAWVTDTRFATLPARLANREALEAAIGEWTAARDVADIETTLAAAGVPVHRVATSADAFADPQLGHRHHFVTVEHPELGPVPVENSRFILPGTPARVERPGPTFGQDNEYVLKEILGMDDEAIVELIAAGALE